MKGRISNTDWMRLLAGRSCRELSKKSGVPTPTIRDMANGKWNDTAYSRGHKVLVASGMDVHRYGPHPPWPKIITAIKKGGLSRMWIARKIGVSSALVDLLHIYATKEPMYTNGHNLLVLYEHLVSTGIVEEVL